MVRVFTIGPGKKWYLMSPCFTLSSIWYKSRVKWNNPEKGVVLSTTHQLLKRELSGHLQLQSTNLLIYIYRERYI